MAWPTAEFASSNIDSLARLTAAEEAASADQEESYEDYLAPMLESARAVNSGGTNYGVDDVIDPADTRSWIVQGLRSAPPVPERTEKKRPSLDTW